MPRDKAKTADSCAPLSILVPVKYPDTADNSDNVNDVIGPSIREAMESWFIYSKVQAWSGVCDLVSTMYF